MKQHQKLSIFFSIALLTTVHLKGAQVNSITGDTGSAQSGALTISGGTSGAAFDTSTSTITQSFNYINLPYTSSTNGQILIGTEAVLHTYGSGQGNLFVGPLAGNFSLTGASYNVACGGYALGSLIDDSQNTAVGYGALYSLADSAGNNTAIGYTALESLVNGGANIAIGALAGTNYIGSESNNILIGNYGTAGDNSVMRLGLGNGNVAATYIDGIYGNPVDPTTGLPVFVDYLGTMGTFLSSAQFKENINPIGSESDLMMQLQPVSFSMKSDKKKTKQYGLIAEEVYPVFPDLVVLDKKGNPYAVRYHEMPVLLLSELQKKSALIATLQSQVADLLKRVAKLEANSK